MGSLPVTYRSGPVELGHGFSIELSFDGTRIDCEWLPKLPEPEIGRQLMPCYVEVRNAFLAKVAEEAGVSFAIVDLPAGASVTRRRIRKAPVPLHAAGSRRKESGSTERRIFIRPEPFGTGFDITVEPAPEWASHNAERPTIRAAWRYADSLRIVHGWRVVDESGAS